MGKSYERLDEQVRGFVAKQPVFFVATAPTDRDGHVNVSPKGYADTFSILDDHTVAYADLTGSGAETAAHLQDNARITIMFCAFEGPPRVLRLYGAGRVVLPATPDWDRMAERFAPHPGLRAVIVVDVQRISDSCGYGVPLLHYERDRPVLDQWAERKGEEELERYRADRNARSIDGLPALPGAVAD